MSQTSFIVQSFYLLFDYEMEPQLSALSAELFVGTDNEESFMIIHGLQGYESFYSCDLI
jgi:hypothetical protein